MFIKDRYNGDLHEVLDETRLSVNGKYDITYYKTEQVGYFVTDDGKKDLTSFEDEIIWLPNEMNNDLKKFLYEYIDLETLNEFVSELKKYEVTLRDCTYFIDSHEEISEKQSSGTNSILFHSKTTHGYCYVIHGFIVDEEEGTVISNTFEFIDIDGQKKSIKL